MDENTYYLNKYHNAQDKLPEPNDMRDHIAKALCRGVRFEADTVHLSFEDIQDICIGADIGLISIFKASDLGIDFPQRKEEMDAAYEAAFRLAHTFEDEIMRGFENEEELLDYIHWGQVND